MLKKNIWMKNYIGEEILDDWDQTVWKSKLKWRSHAIFVIVLNLSKMDYEYLLVFYHNFLIRSPNEVLFVALES